MDPRVSFITLAVADLSRSRAFYEALGWREHPQPSPGIVFFQAGGQVIGLFGRQDLAEDAGLPADGSGFGGITLAHNVRSEAEVDALMVEAVAAGARVTQPASRVFWGGYRGYFADPDGHPWEICFNPHAIPDETGAIRLR